MDEAPRVVSNIAKLPIQAGRIARHFQWRIVRRPPKAWCLSGTVAEAYSTPNGGSNGNDLSDHVRAVVGCYGHLQSAGNASRPLYCGARLV